MTLHHAPQPCSSRAAGAAALLGTVSHGCQLPLECPCSSSINIGVMAVQAAGCCGLGLLSASGIELFRHAAASRLAMRVILFQTRVSLDLCRLCGQPCPYRLTISSGSCLKGTLKSTSLSKGLRASPGTHSHWPALCQSVSHHSRKGELSSFLVDKGHELYFAIKFFHDKFP